MDRKVYHLCRLLCLLFLLMVCGTTVYAAEESRLDWQYDAMAHSFSIGSTGQKGICAVALYDENGRMFSFGMAERSEMAEAYISCSPCILPTDFEIRFFLFDEAYRPAAAAEVYSVHTTAATCTTNGTINALSADGSTSRVIANLPATGHSITETVLQQPIDDVHCGSALHICANCELTETVPIYPDCTIPRLKLYGSLEGIGKKAEVPMTVEFSGAGQELDCYALLKYQGHTSLIYDKKNFTLKLFKDDRHEQKNKIVFFDWNKEHKYILKANYIDPSVCRNLVCADIWSEMAACREDYPARLADSSNFGATDGFPLALYLNDEFQGLYTMTLHRDDDLFDMEDGNLDGIVVANTANTEAAFFKAPATFDDASDWEVEYSGLEDDTLWLEDKLNDLITFVRTASEDEFKENLHQYLDVNSAVDYLTAIYSLGLTNSGAKNITMATYDNGVLFFSLCDMENAFGLSPDGTEILDPADYLPTCTDGTWDSATGSLLWDRMLHSFYPEICARYTELRREILTAERICGKVETFLQPISQDFYAADKLLYPQMPDLPIDAQTQIENYVPQRLLLLDALFLNRETE